MGRVQVHSYGDGTVDGEYAVAVPRGKATEDLIWELMEAFDTEPEGMGSEYWLQVGQRYTIKEDEEVYRRYRGMNEFGIHFTRVSTAGIIPAFGAARKEMTRGAEKKYRRKADSVFVRIHWNPSNARPKR